MGSVIIKQALWEWRTVLVQWRLHYADHVAAPPALIGRPAARHRVCKWGCPAEPKKQWNNSVPRQPDQLGFVRFRWVFTGFPGFYWVLLGSTGFYWVLLFTKRKGCGPSPRVDALPLSSSFLLMFGLSSCWSDVEIEVSFHGLGCLWVVVGWFPPLLYQLLLIVTHSSKFRVPVMSFELDVVFLFSFLQVFFFCN